jgi:hypothetical protein
MVILCYINFFCFVFEVLRVLVQKRLLCTLRIIQGKYFTNILYIVTLQYIPIHYNMLQYIETHYNILKDITWHYKISFNYNTHVKYLILYLYSLYITLILHCIPQMFLLIWRFERLLHKKGLTGIFWSTLTGDIFGWFYRRC